MEERRKGGREMEATERDEEGGKKSILLQII